jgi:phosphate transport system substrate-binding protein
VAKAVEDTPFSIGYVEWIYALQQHLSFGPIRNASGRFSTASLDSIAAGISSATSPSAYPIVSFTYLLIPTMGKSTAKSEVLRDLLKWIFTYGQNQAAGLGYVALPRDVAERSAASVAKIR